MQSIRTKSSGRRRLILLIIVGAVAVILLQTPLKAIGTFMGPFDGALSTLERSAGGAGSWVKDRFAGFDSVRNERDQALHELELARAEVAWLGSSVQDAELLRTMREDVAQDRIVASALSVPNESPYDTVVIDKGARDGIKTGALVFSETSMPLGTVVETRNRTAVVMLFTSPGTRSLVYSPRERVFARATGMGGGTFTVLMPHGSTVIEGDSFILPTISGEFIGTVSHTWSDPTEPGVLAAVTSSSSVRSLRFVAVDREPFDIPSAEAIRETIALHATSTAPLFELPPEFGATTTATTTPQ